MASLRGITGPAPARLRTLTLTILTMCAFAANSFLCRIALAQAAIDPASFTVVRLASGAAALWLILTLASKPTAPTWKAAPALALFGYAVAFSCAYIWLPAGTGALLLFGAVQVTMIGYGLFRGERLAPLQWLGLLVAICGAGILLAPGASAPSVPGAALMLFAGVAWGIYSLLGRGVADPLHATYSNFALSLPCAVVLAVIILWLGPALSATGLVCAVLSGAIASGVGYTIWYAALPGLTPTQGASVQLSVPVITAVGGALMLGEAITLRLTLASVAILGGIALVITQRQVGKA